MSKKTKNFATAAAPVIEAVMEQLLSLASEAQALEWLRVIEDGFVTSKHQLPTKDRRKSVILWVKDYEVSDEEKAKGYLGHFIAVSYKPKDKRWTLYPTKMLMDLKHHPQRAYKNDQKHPNWGHPILRAIKKSKPYKTLDAANAALNSLHEDFPTASIPTKSKLYLMIFSREDNPAKPVQKYVFEIRALPNGHYTIDYRLNDGKKEAQPKTMRKKLPKKTVAQSGVQKDNKTKENKGLFTARESLRRQRKTRK